MPPISRPFWSFVAVGIAGLPVPSAWAESTYSVSLDAITVTARRVAEPFHQVPFGLSVLDGQQMQDNRQIDTKTAARTIPNVNFTDSGLPQANLINIRGIGSSSALVGPSVTYYIDGVPVPHRAFDQSFLDAQRVEILRGPQGTLFGQNAQAGAVSLVTRDPDQQPEFELGGEIGSRNHRRLSASASGPITDKLSGRLAASFDGRDGDIGNSRFDSQGNLVGTDRDIGAHTLGNLHGKLKLTPGDATTITLSGRFQRDHRDPTTGVLIGLDDDQANALSPTPRNELHSGGLNLTIHHDFDGVRFTSLTGYQAYDLAMRADITDGYLSSRLTGRPPGLFAQPNTLRTIDEDQQQWSQEFRLDGKTAGGTMWVAGLSGLYADFTSGTDITSPALPNGLYSADQRTTNLALFGEATIPVTDSLRAIGGLRVTQESKDFTGRFTGRSGGTNAVAAFREAGDIDSAFVTGRTGLSYDLAPDFAAYATIGRGEKSGGYPIYNQYAAAGLATPSFRNSVTWSYETGLRGKLFDRKLDLNAALFFNDTKDDQLFSFNPVAGQFRVENADTETYGLELEATFRPVTGFSLSGSLALLHGEVTGSAAGSTVRPGHDIPYAPRLTASLAAQYLWSADGVGLDGDFFVRGDYQHVGSRVIDPANSYRLSGYNLVNLRIGWMTERFDLYAFADNLLDVDYLTSGFRAGAATDGSSVFAGVPGSPRTIGLGAKVRF